MLQEAKANITINFYVNQLTEQVFFFFFHSCIFFLNEFLYSLLQESVHTKLTKHNSVLVFFSTTQQSFSAFSATDLVNFKCDSNEKGRFTGAHH